MQSGATFRAFNAVTLDDEVVKTCSVTGNALGAEVIAIENALGPNAAPKKIGDDGHSSIRHVRQIPTESLIEAGRVGSPSNDQHRHLQMSESAPLLTIMTIRNQLLQHPLHL